MKKHAQPCGVYVRIEKMISTERALKKKLGEKTQVAMTNRGDKFYFSPEVFFTVQVLHDHGIDASEATKEQVIHAAALAIDKGEGRTGVIIDEANGVGDSAPAAKSENKSVDSPSEAPAAKPLKRVRKPKEKKAVEANKSKDTSAEAPTEAPTPGEAKALAAPDVPPVAPVAPVAVEPAAVTPEPAAAAAGVATKKGRPKKVVNDLPPAELPPSDTVSDANCADVEDVSPVAKLDTAREEVIKASVDAFFSKRPAQDRIDFNPYISMVSLSLGLLQLCEMYDKDPGNENRRQSLDSMAKDFANSMRASLAKASAKVINVHA